MKMSGEQPERSILCTTLAGAALLQACAAQQPPPEPITIAVQSGPAGSCLLEVNGQQLNDDQLGERLRHRRRDQAVIVTGISLDVPYRCIGSVIYSLRSAHVQFKLPFIAEPPQAGPDAR